VAAVLTLITNKNKYT